MWESKRISNARAALALGAAPPVVAVVVAAGLAFLAGCSARTLILVDPREAGVIPNIDAPVAPDRFDAADGTPTTLTNGLVGLWHFDDGTGSTTARDSSPNGNDGTLVFPASSNPWTDGHIGTGSLDTAGVGYASVPRSASIDGIVSQVTMSAWVYFVGPVAVDYATAISRQVGATLQQRYHLSVYLDGTPNLYIQAAGLCQAGGPTAAATANASFAPIRPSTWTHLAGTYDGSQALLYVNGVLVASTTCGSTFPAETTPVILGGNGNGRQVTEMFPGMVDEVILYDRALDASEIQQLAAGVTF